MQCVAACLHQQSGDKAVDPALWCLLQCVEVCLQGFAVCRQCDDSVMQRVCVSSLATILSTLRSGVCCSVLQCVCMALQGVAVCCKCDAVCCSVSASAA